MVLIAAIVGIQNRSEFMISLTIDLHKDIEDFHVEANRFLQQEDASIEMEILEVIANKDGGPSNTTG